MCHITSLGGSFDSSHPAILNDMKPHNVDARIRHSSVAADSPLWREELSLADSSHADTGSGNDDVGKQFHDRRIQVESVL